MTSVNSDYGLYGALGLTRQTETEKASDQLAQEDFLALMVTELTNQDPTNPVDNAGMAAQFANFSTVTGINNLSNAFSDLSSSLMQSQSLQAANLVGKTVLVEGNTAQLNATGNLSGKVRLDSSASDIQVQIYDANGQLVRKLDLGTKAAGDVSFSWDGLTDQGTRAPTGTYKIQVQANSGEQALTPKVLVSGLVESVALNGGKNLVINVQGMGALDFDQILAIT